MAFTYFHKIMFKIFDNDTDWLYWHNKYFLTLSLLYKVLIWKIRIFFRIEKERTLRIDKQAIIGLEGTF